MSVGTNTVNSNALMIYVERVEHINAEAKALSEDRKVIVAEAVRDGFSAKGINFCVKARAMKPREFEENEQVRDMYLHAVGMASELPLFRQIDALAGEGLVRDALIERFKALVPSKGEITLKLEDGLPIRLWRDKDGKPHAEEVRPPKPRATASAASTVRAPPIDVPDVDAPGAENLGRQFASDNKPIISNPFPFGDPRRPRFDVGWRKQAGGDGMGPDDR